jgi:hypothetical protein
METYVGIWETSFFRDKIKDNMQYVDVFNTLVVPVKPEYKVVLGIHVGVTYSRIKKKKKKEYLLGSFQRYNPPVPVHS